MTIQNVLIVEDEPAIAGAIEARLQAEGFSTTIAPDGQAALDAVARALPDLILLDVMIPVFSGIEVCQKVKSDPKTKAVPIIMVTVLSEPSDFAKAVRAGADDYVCKPFEFSDLLRKIRQFNPPKV
jgi:DNA-binding response OmpR family regulator